MMPAAQAVEVLIAEYGKLVFQTIYGLTGDWEESQDLTQDTFSQAFKAIDAARAKSGSQFHAKAWLLRIAINTVRMQQRRRSLFRFIPFSQMRRQEQRAGEADETESNALNEAAAPVQPVGYGAYESTNPETLVAERDAVRRTMARLTENLRVCLLLSVIGDFSSPEIAEMLGLEEATVRQRLARARKQFQQLYALESGEEVIDNVPTPAVDTGPAQTPKTGRQQRSRMERVESHLRSDTLTDKAKMRRKYGEGLYRDPALAPLW
jgi:RNA polymerase sigma factor (sigma-70 family)